MNDDVFVRAIEMILDHIFLDYFSLRIHRLLWRLLVKPLWCVMCVWEKAYYLSHSVSILPSNELFKLSDLDKLFN